MVICTSLVFIAAIALFSISFVSNRIVWFVLAICLFALWLVILTTGIYSYYHMGIDKVRVQRIEKEIDAALGDSDATAQLSRSYVCCNKYNVHRPYPAEIPSYCCPKRYEKCDETRIFKKGCFEAMLDKAPYDELAFFLGNCIVYLIFISLGIGVAVAEASHLRYRKY